MTIAKYNAGGSEEEGRELLQETNSDGSCGSKGAGVSRRENQGGLPSFSRPHTCTLCDTIANAILSKTSFALAHLLQGFELLSMRSTVIRARITACALVLCYHRCNSSSLGDSSMKLLRTFRAEHSYAGHG